MIYDLHKQIKRNPVFIKLTQWEHWPTFIYYIPLLPFFLFRSIKAGHPFHYTTANPAILYSGNGTESKFKTLSLLPEKFRPKSFLISNGLEIDTILDKIKHTGITYPLIAKPDIGFRGYLVKKLNNVEELLSYLKNVKEDIIIQEFIPYMNEVGLFYHRMPGDPKGSLSSVTLKRFIRVVGDGSSTLAELILNDKRAFLYFDVFKNIHKEKMNTIYKEGQSLTLSVIGNHSKGTEFINGNHLISRELENFTDVICKQIEGWYYGRLDIKFNDLDELLQGKEFKVLEINGIISEPTHIYDASYEGASYFKALKAINDHWRIMSKIALKNHEDQSISYPKIMSYIKNMLWLRAHTKKLKKLNAKNF